MNKLVFDAQIIGLRSCDYEYLQNSIESYSSTIYRQLLSNPNTPAIIQGFDLQIDSLDNTQMQVDVSAITGLSGLVTQSSVVVETSTGLSGISLSDDTLGIVNYVYAHYYTVKGTYDLTTDTIYEGVKAAIDISNYTLQYNRSIDRVEIAVMTAAEYALVTSTGDYVFLGSTVAQGAGQPLTTIDKTGVVYALLTIPEGQITVSNLSPSFLLPQTMVDNSETVDDTYYGTPVNVEDDLNRVRTEIKNIKGTPGWEDSTESSLINFDPAPNRLHINGVSPRYGLNFETTIITSTGRFYAKIGSGKLLLDGSIISIPASQYEYRELPELVTYAYGYDSIPPEVRSPVYSGDLVVLNEIANHAVIDETTLRIYDSQGGLYSYWTDYIYDTSTGTIHMYSDSYAHDGIIIIWYRYGFTQYQSVDLSSAEEFVIREGNGWYPPIPADMDGLRFYNILRNPYINPITSDLQDCRNYFHDVREVTDVFAEDYTHAPYTLNKFTYFTSTGTIDEIFEQWLFTSTGIESLAVPSYAAISILCRENDELYLRATTFTSTGITTTVSYEEIPGSDIFTDIIIDTTNSSGEDSVNNIIFVVKGLSEGYHKVKVTNTSVLHLCGIVYGKLGYYYTKNNPISSDAATIETLKVQPASQGVEIGDVVEYGFDETPVVKGFNDLSSVDMIVPSHYSIIRISDNKLLLWILDVAVGFNRLNILIVNDDGSITKGAPLDLPYDVYPAGLSIVMQSENIAMGVYVVGTTSQFSVFRVDVSGSVPILLGSETPLSELGYSGYYDGFTLTRLSDSRCLFMFASSTATDLVYLILNVSSDVITEVGKDRIIGISPSFGYISVVGLTATKAILVAGSLGIALFEISGDVITYHVADAVELKTGRTIVGELTSSLKLTDNKILVAVGSKVFILVEDAGKLFLGSNVITCTNMQSSWCTPRLCKVSEYSYLIHYNTNISAPTSEIRYIEVDIENNYLDLKESGKVISHGQTTSTSSTLFSFAQISEGKVLRSILWTMSSDAVPPYIPGTPVLKSNIICGGVYSIKKVQENITMDYILGERILLTESTPNWITKMDPFGSNKLAIATYHELVVYTINDDLTVSQSNTISFTSMIGNYIRYMIPLTENTLLIIGNNASTSTTIYCMVIYNYDGSITQVDEYTDTLYKIEDISYYNKPYIHSAFIALGNTSSTPHNGVCIMCSLSYDTNYYFSMSGGVKQLETSTGIEIYNPKLVRLTDWDIGGNLTALLMYYVNIPVAGFYMRLITGSYPFTLSAKVVGPTTHYTIPFRVNSNTVMVLISGGIQGIYSQTIKIDMSSSSCSIGEKSWLYDTYDYLMRSFSYNTQLHVVRLDNGLFWIAGLVLEIDGSGIKVVKQCVMATDSESSTISLLFSLTLAAVIYVEFDGTTYWTYLQFYKSNSSNVDRIYGIVKENKISGQDCQVALVEDGKVVTSLTGLINNSIYYLRDGKLTTKKTKNKIGKAVSTTVLKISKNSVPQTIAQAKRWLTDFLP